MILHATRQQCLLMDVSFERYLLSRPTMGTGGSTFPRNQPWETFSRICFPSLLSKFSPSFWRTRALHHTQMIRVSNHNLSIRITNKQKFSVVPLVYISSQTNKQKTKKMAKALQARVTNICM